MRSKKRRERDTVQGEKKGVAAAICAGGSVFQLFPRPFLFLAYHKERRGHVYVYIYIGIHRAQSRARIYTYVPIPAFRHACALCTLHHITHAYGQQQQQQQWRKETEPRALRRIPERNFPLPFPLSHPYIYSRVCVCLCLWILPWQLYHYSFFFSFSLLSLREFSAEFPLSSRRFCSRY